MVVEDSMLTFMLGKYIPTQEIVQVFSGKLLDTQHSALHHSTSTTSSIYRYRQEAHAFHTWNSTSGLQSL